ncbi:alpha/beta fold hydrolase [Terriglobus sp. TAA 43]|uniref:alpha/beta fold hydrolase n=1 Tax=Terriglobus sp. TAA 43 TaxID=278961 RepID=UPI000648085A|nr:alpha/beta hydrolase [Terriglobus sp. TAA 43]
MKNQQLNRRTFLGAAAMMAGSSLFGSAAAQTEATDRGTQSATPSSSRAEFTTIHQVKAGVLDIGYVDEGPRDGRVVILLHGWPYDIHSFVDVVPILTAANFRVIVPHLRGYGTTRFLSKDSVRNGQQSAFALDVLALMDVLFIKKAIVAGFDWGARTACILAALWPDRFEALVSVSGYLIGNQKAGRAPLVPTAELQWWYQFYFATDRGREGYQQYRREFAKQIWTLASPQWHYNDVVFDRSATAFDNPDHVDIVIHNYRWRLDLAQGETRYDSYEQKLASGPVITVPTITMEGDANGAPHPDSNNYAKKFSGKYEHRLIRGGVGHNLPQEAPEAFAKAITGVVKL